ncbi:hypothetical protein Glove_152g68 [Diversispora epigaea]|uniref:Uncharacterized protein n=1 Tax=Diversispora epigaea TaxID=1348612 RepID=A0A397IWF1_9GLOM|nr:hypothetical protein Glove_152g68 [Diversispora epigaea]
MFHEDYNNSDRILVDEHEIGNGAYRSIKSLLQILIPIWKNSNSLVLQIGDIIKLKLGGDGRKEKYDTLEKVAHIFNDQLSELQENGIYDNDNIHWKIEFFFSADWKFMYIIMGLNALNLKYFCLYCDCELNNRWNMNLQWIINKNTKDQKKPVLFPVIKQENYIPDELHLLLRISDVLMECFFNDLFKKKEFEQQIKNQIEQVMKDIKIHFEFFKSKSNDIQKLWHDFYELYTILRKPFITNSEINNLKIKAKEWINLFCRPNQGQMNSPLQVHGLYKKEDVTPYMHVFSQHIPEFLEKLNEKNLSIRYFSTFSLEKKNHNQVRLFFSGTTMGGGSKEKSVVYDIMEFENRQLYYLLNDTPQKFQMQNINLNNKENKK